MLKQNNLTALVRRYKDEAGAQAKETMELILGIADAPRQIYTMIYGKDQRAALRVLADLCRKKAVREVVAPLVVQDAGRLIDIADDKARKTAYVLIGLCGADECADKLLLALKNEKTRFTRPSIILALGNTKAPARYLENYIIEPGETKHVEEERDALKKALGKAAGPQKIAKISLPVLSTLTCINARAMEAELHDLNIEAKPSALIGAYDVRTSDIGRLRCYEDALYYIGSIGEFENAANRLNKFGCSGAMFRVEAGYIRPEKRRDSIRSVIEGLAPFGYHDNPSSYAFEIRVYKKFMYVKFPGDPRFAYRKQSISASINPVTAASIMRLCRPYMKENARVLDPFCGSGTLLIERALILKTDSLVGVDISSEAIKAACANRKASGLKIALIHGDVLSFGASRYDEVIANLPFGIRVSGHESNQKLYAAFIGRLPKLLDDGGYAYLYTLEKTLLRDEVDVHPELMIIDEELFDSGGLSPTLFIIKKEQIS